MVSSPTNRTVRNTLDTQTEHSDTRHVHGFKHQGKALTAFPRTQNDVEYLILWFQQVLSLNQVESSNLDTPGTVTWDISRKLKAHAA